MCKRFFTVREANALIPFLNDRLPLLRSAYREAEAASEEHAPTLQDVITAGGIPVHPKHYDLLFHLQTLAAEIGAKGCHIKDLDAGLVDFPTVWEGREVYLCWKLGESEVGYWHEIDAGFAGRQPLKCKPKAESGH